MPRPVWLTGLAVVGIVACGDGGGVAIDSPCDLADAEMVETAFGGTVAEGVEGEFLNCDFEIEEGSTLIVSVFDSGDADDWDDTRQGFIDNRDGVTDVEDIGDAAFYPKDTGPSELVVQAGGRIFSVTVFSGLDEPSTAAMNGLYDLAKAIAERLAS